MRAWTWTALAWLVPAVVGCGDEATQPEPSGPRDAATRDARAPRADASLPAPGEGEEDSAGGIEGLTLRADVAPVKSAAEAQPRTFIPPFVACQPPKEGEPPGEGPEGQVCANVAISGATEPGRRFADYADCDVVKTQRPFWPRSPARESDPNDPRLSDDAYLAELGWVREQIEATGCVCCHDSKILGGQAGQWDIQLGPLWLDSLSDSGLALFAGLADSSVLGAYPAEQNYGFDRMITGVPTTDTPRMQKFMRDELARRGISEEEARAVPPFGGPIYANRVAEPGACKAGERVTPDGTLIWTGGAARYVYVMREGSENPGVPPNLDLPEGTLFRLDVLASAEPIASGVPYGSTPAGTFQAFPADSRAEALQQGERYQLYVLKDVGLPIANCVFTYGEQPPEEPEIDAGTPPTPAPGDAGTCALPDDGWGAPCKDATNSSDCPCAADYCALMPGQSEGYCTRTGCNTDPSVCRDAWSCFDISQFAPGQPAICIR